LGNEDERRRNEMNGMYIIGNKGMRIGMRIGMSENRLKD